MSCPAGPVQAHGVLPVPVADQREVGEQRNLAYVTRHEILHIWTKFQVCGPFRLASYKEQTDGQTESARMSDRARTNNF